MEWSKEQIHRKPLYHLRGMKSITPKARTSMKINYPSNTPLPTHFTREFY